MNIPLILKLSAAILFGCGHLVHAAVDETKTDPRADKDANSAAAASIGATTSDGQGTVTYNQKEVWRGKVRQQLIAIARSVGDKGYDGDYAAAWDGKRLVWESVKGAGDKLKGESRELLRRQRKPAQ